MIWGLVSSVTGMTSGARVGFCEFGQGKSSTRARASGIGLVLSICAFEEVVAVLKQSVPQKLARKCLILSFRPILGSILEGPTNFEFFLGVASAS